MRQRQNLLPSTTERRGFHADIKNYTFFTSNTAAAFFNYAHALTVLQESSSNELEMVILAHLLIHLLGMCIEKLTIFEKKV